MEKKIVPTKTDVTSVALVVNIFTYYSNTVNSLVVFISNTLQTVKGVLFKENELGVTKEGYEDISFLLNNKGELLVQHNTDKTFSINSNGELIMEETN